MPKALSSKDIVKILLENWFEPKRQKWSHKVYAKKENITIVPMNKQHIPIWTIKSIVRQSWLDNSLFFDY